VEVGQSRRPRAWPSCHGLHTGERTVVRSSVLADAGYGDDPCGCLGGDLHEGVNPLSLVLNVEPRLPQLNQLHLLHQRVELVGDVLPLDPLRSPNQLPSLFPFVRPKIRQHPGTDPHGFPHVEQFLVGPDHPIDTGSVLDPGSDELSKCGVGLHEIRAGAFAVSSGR
jgi:hypothetical protein